MIRSILILAMVFIPYIMEAQSGIIKHNYEIYSHASSSVLADGKWFKFKVYNSGIYKLTYDDIKSMGFSNPGEVKIFGNGGHMLPFNNSSPRPDDLTENAIYMNKGSDNVFNQGDFILFYCQGPVVWSYNSLTSMFENSIHLYSTASYYFVTTDAGVGKRITMQPVLTGSPDFDIVSFDDYSFHEKNWFNFLKSGRQWFGDRIDYTPFDSTFIFDHIINSSPVKIKANVVSRSDNFKQFSLSVNNNPVGIIEVPSVILSNKTGTYANQKSAVFNVISSADNLNVKLNYNKISSTDEGYIDYIILNARRSLYLNGNWLYFRDQTYSGTENIARYIVNNCSSLTQVWNISDPCNVTHLSTQIDDNTLTFIDSTTVLKEYVALDLSAEFPKPEIKPNNYDIGIIQNQNLHASLPHQMIIITHPLFKDAADSIAKFHQEKDNLDVYTVTTEQVFNEFSSGTPDVSAIRDFVKFIYDKSAGDDSLKYLLLIGDGSYNNFSHTEGNVNYILTYQSENSLNASYSYVSDDFFGFLEESEGGSENMETYSLDIGIGRLPVKSKEEALAVYNKIKQYNCYENKGDWQNNILFAADDGDGNIHMEQSDELAEWINNYYPQFGIKKVFIDAYPQVASSVGSRYPQAKSAIIQNIQKGALIFNYTGHGGELGLADEQILLREDLEEMTNIKHLPLFITATCEFSRFDDLTKDENGVLSESTSAGEASLLNPNGGSIALLTTTRIVYSNENYDLNTRFYEMAFKRNSLGEYYSMGDIIRIIKNQLGSSRNKLNFILLGDPALKLAVPNYTIVTDSINHLSVYEETDTLKAFSRVVITGHIEDNENNLVPDYNGIIFPSVYDKEKTITTLANDYGSSPMQFSAREDLLYKGKSSVINGRFSFEFMVPKDITYSFGKGQILYYSFNNEYDAYGQTSSFIIGGTDYSAEPDNTGPEISLYFNDELFNNNGITNPNPVIYAKIEDESGINTIGNGIGHDITGIIDDNTAFPVIMNDYFEANLDDYTSGILSYPMKNLSEGIHSLTVKVWDIYNNSSEKTLEFNVIPGKKAFIAKIINYPNPASEYTTFIFEHNKPEEELTVTISVFDLSGRLIYKYNQTQYASGYNTPIETWDLKDLNGNKLKQGIYPYQIRITSMDGSVSESYQKLVVLR